MKKISSQEVYEILRLKIIQGEIRPGESLKEVNLVDEYGISRTPIREALKKLESRGLLSYEKNKGMVVTILDSKAIAELFVMREMLESTATALAARYATNEEISILKDIVHEDANNLNDFEALSKKNKLFHHTINQLARNHYLLEFFSLLNESMSLLGKTSLSNITRAEKTLKQHQEIVSAIEARDEEKARALAIEHVKSAYRARLRIMIDIESS